MNGSSTSSLRAGLAALLTGALVAACGPVAVGTPSPASPGRDGREPAGSPSISATGGWEKAVVEEPAESITGPSAQPAFCSPCHPANQTYIQALAAGGPGLVGVGLGFDGAASHAAAWTSTDGRAWARSSGLPAPDGSTITALAAGPHGRLVAVGGGAHGGAAWVSDDGRQWRQAPDQPALAGPATLTQLLAVVAWGGGFLAAGAADPAWGEHRAAFWASPDGLAWQRLPDPPAASGARVQGLAVGRHGLVAVGSRGDPERGTGAAWVSADGRSWLPASGPDLGLGPLHAVTAGGPGFVAVGEAATGDRAVAWTSTDGSAWTAAPDAAALHAFGDQRAVMLAVTAAAGRLLAVGWISDLANGSAAAWVSTDGRAWRRLPDDATFAGGGMAAAVPVDGRPVAAGTTGWPDNKVATVWLGPPLP